MSWKDTLKLIAGTSFVTLIRFVLIGGLLNLVFVLTSSPLLFDKGIITDIGAQEEAVLEQ